eukprot:5644620-Amphidinium_carterae.1
MFKAASAVNSAVNCDNRTECWCYAYATLRQEALRKVGRQPHSKVNRLVVPKEPPRNWRMHFRKSSLTAGNNSQEGACACMPLPDNTQAPQKLDFSPCVRTWYT